MNIPPKYEDVAARLDAALHRESLSDKHLGESLEREAALREELATIYSDRDAEKEMKAKARDQRDVQTIRACELQQRLTVAEKRASVLESAAREMIRIAGIANQGSNAYNRAIINLNAALKPAEGEGS